MKKQAFKWLAVFSLLLMLLPTTTQAAGTAEEIWVWKSTATGNRVDSIAMFGSNLVNETGSDSKAYPVFDCTSAKTIYNEDGPLRQYAMAFRGDVAKDDNGNYYGAPYRIVNGYAVAKEAVYFQVGRASESMEIETAFPISVSDYEAVNLKFIYADILVNGDNVLPYCRDMEVQVSLDGEAYLSDSVGIRSTKLLGGGKTKSGTTTYDVLVYEIQTENLLNIDGVTGAIRDIRVWPEGKEAAPSSRITFSEISLNGYENEEDWLKAVPAEERGTITVTEEQLRQQVVDEALRTANLSWTPTEDITVAYGTGESNDGGSGGTVTYTAGTTYFGPIYNRSADATREQIAAAIADGTYEEQKLGMDCQTFAFNATSRVSQNYGWAVAKLSGASGLTLLGEDSLVTSARNAGAEEQYPVRFTDVDIVALNDANALYTKNYDALQKGDLLVHYRANENNERHVRIVQSVDKVNQKVTCIESSSSILSRTDKSGSGSVWVNKEYTYAKLYEDAYVGYTLDTYAQAAASGTIEAVDVEAVFSPKETGKSIAESGVHLSVASNYRIVSYTVKLEKSDGTEIWNSGCQYLAGEQNHVGFVYENEELDQKLAEQEGKDYTLSVTVKSGPVGADGEVPSITRTLVVGSCNGHIGWTEVSDGSIDLNLAAGGKYVLKNDVALAVDTLALSRGEVTLCLNGHKLSTTYEGESALITVNGGTLNICDCAGGGTLEGNAYRPLTITGGTVNLFGGNLTNPNNTTGFVPGVWVTQSGIFNMYGGKITGMSTTGSSSVVQLSGTGNSAVFNMYGGTIDNNATSDNGGGVSVKDGAKFNMYGGSIQNNESVKNAGGVYVTGAGSEFCMYGGTICKNTATGIGGGVSVRSAGVFKMYAGDIDDNTSSSNGGGVYVGDASAVVYLSGGTIKNNTAAGSTGGGGVYSSGTGSFHMSGGTITGNKATYSSGKGGGVYLSAGDGTKTLTGGVIFANTASANADYYLGSGIVLNGTGNYPVAPTAPVCGEHTGWEALTSTTVLTGGTNYVVNGDLTDVILTSGDTGDVTLCLGGHTLTAASSQQLITWSSSGTLNICDCNAVSGTLKGNGTYVIHTSNGTVNLFGGTVHGGEATSAVANVIVYGSNSATFNMVGGAITGNRDTGNNGGGARVNAGNTFNMYGGKIYDNKPGRGGGFWLVGGTLNLIGGTICDNTATYQYSGAGVYGNGASTFNMYGGTISGNTASNSDNNTKGAGVYSEGKFNMYGGTISSNKAISGGGVYFGGSGTFTMHGGTISNNNANVGGGVYMANSGNTFKLKNGTITGNDATSGSGGGIYNAGALAMDNGIISGNTVTSEGGGVYVKSSGSFTMSGGDIATNTAKYGGGVYVQSGGSFTMSGGDIDGNNAKGSYAGGIYVGGTTTITGGTITNNTATGVGGGIRQGDGSTLTVSGDTQITGNKTEASGGGVYVQNGCTFNMNGGIISGNTAAAGGSGLYGNYTGKVTTIAVTDGSIAGAIETTEGATVTISGGQFSADNSWDTLNAALDTSIPALTVAEIEDGDYVYTVTESGFANSGAVIDHESAMNFNLVLATNADTAEKTFAYTVTDGFGIGGTVATDSATGSPIVTATGLAAKQMHDKITFTVTDESGSVWFKKTVSLYDAAKMMYEDANSSQEEKTLLVDMINYGVEAQKVFKYNTEKVSVLAESTTAEPKWESGAAYDGTAAVAVSLNLKDEIELNVYVKNADVTLEENESEYVVETDEASGVTRVTFHNIAVKDYDVQKAVTLSDESTLSVSIQDYVATALADENNDQKDLLVALKKYVQSVCDYLEN